MSEILDAFKQLDMFNEDVFDTSVDSLKELDDFDDEVDIEPTEIIDTDAENEEELKDNYVGDVILECTVCGTKIYKKP